MTIVNSATMNIGVHIYFQMIVSLDICPGEEFLDRMVALCLVFK